MSQTDVLMWTTIVLFVFSVFSVVSTAFKNTQEWDERKKRTTKFDCDFADLKMHLSNNEIPPIVFDQKSHPSNVVIPVWVPEGEIQIYPRLFVLTRKTTGFWLPDGTEEVFCATDFFKTDSITIHMPHSMSGRLEISTDDLVEGSIRILIWVRKA